MPWQTTRRWRGPIRAVIFDLAGTVIDHGCCAPVDAFLTVLRRRGVELSPARAREPMGTHKRTHLEALCAMPEVADAFCAAHGHAITEPDIDAMYTELVDVQLGTLADHAEPIPGVLDAIEALRRRDIRIGATTGYIPEMLSVAAAAAAERGYHPDCAVSAGEVPVGRPAPFMIFEAMSRLGVWPTAAVVKVGDTVSDVEAGLAAGVWTVGVAVTGNEVGLDLASYKALDPDARARRRATARDRLAAAGAHLVLDSAAQIGEAVDHFERRMRDGARP